MIYSYSSVSSGVKEQQRPPIIGLDGININRKVLINTHDAVSVTSKLIYFALRAGSVKVEDIGILASTEQLAQELTVALSSLGRSPHVSNQFQVCNQSSKLFGPHQAQRPPVPPPSSSSDLNPARCLDVGLPELFQGIEKDLLIFAVSPSV